MSFLREETKKRGFPTIDGVHMGPCEIHKRHAHTIGPDGSLYACPGFAGDAKQSTGHIDGREETARSRAAAQFEALSAWKECSDCAFIPVCAGGCTVAAHTELGSIEHAELSQDRDPGRRGLAGAPGCGRSLHVHQLVVRSPLNRRHTWRRMKNDKKQNNDRGPFAPGSSTSSSTTSGNRFTQFNDRSTR